MRFLQSNRSKLYVLLLIYSVGVGVSYALPAGITETEWYSFYSYLDTKEVTPYIEVREGYPPIGFLIYMPLYYAFRGNVAAFSYGFRALNGALLVATLGIGPAVWALYGFTGYLTPLVTFVIASIYFRKNRFPDKADAAQAYGEEAGKPSDITHLA